MSLEAKLGFLSCSLLSQAPQKPQRSPSQPLSYLFNFTLYRQTQCVCVFSKMYLFIYWCAGSSQLCTDFLELQHAGATLQMWCTQFSLRRLLLLQQRGSVVVGHELSCSSACGIFPDQGLDLCPMHWQDS